MAIATNGRRAAAVDKTRMPPHDVDAERAVLGALLIDPSAYTLIEGALSATDFYRAQHFAIFEAMAGVAGAAIDFVSVCAELGRAGTLDDAGGETYVAELIAATPTAFHVEHYAAIVRDHAIRRRAIDAAGGIAREAYAQAAVADLIEGAERAVFALGDAAVQGEAATARELAQLVADQLETRLDGAAPRGILSGLEGLDRLTSGWHAGELIVVAARPGMGKSAFALQIALRAAEAGAVPTAIFSLEMSAAELAHRLVAHRTPIDGMALRAPSTLAPAAMAQVLNTLQWMGDVPLYVDAGADSRVMSLCARARRLVARQRVGFIIVDYLQLVTPARERDMRSVEVGEITRRLKLLAGELGVPIVACCQLNRGVEGRADARPRLSDLRESGAIEQDADVVMFLYAPEDSADGQTSNLTLAVAKQRNGPTGDVPLWFKRSTGEFRDVSRGL